MDFAEILADAYTYTKEGVINNRNRWMKLIVAILCLGLPFNGYTMRIYRGAKPAPEVDEWGRLFIDGLKMVAVGIVYILPLVLIGILIFAAMLIAAAASGGIDDSPASSPLSSLFVIVFDILEIVVAVFLPVAYIRLARTGVFSEAFNFSAMKETIGRIGWINYIVATILVGVVVGVPLVILFMTALILAIIVYYISGTSTIVLAAIVLFFIIFVLLIVSLAGVFQARYLTRVYDSAEIPA